MLKEVKQILYLSRFYMLLSGGVFLLSLLGGVAFVHLFPDASANYVNQLQQHLGFVNDFTSTQMFLFLFINNSVKTFLYAVMGILFAVPTVIFLVFIGAVLGFVVAVMYPSLGGVTLFNSLFYHGIFELTAIFIASGVGLFLGAETVKEIGLKIFSKDAVKVVKRSTVYRKHFKPAVYAVLITAIPLLVIAGVIETIMLNILKG